ncbi:hypothetical protein ACLOJK_035764 [Asimina triloba]
MEDDPSWVGPEAAEAVEVVAVGAGAGVGAGGGVELKREMGSKTLSASYTATGAIEKTFLLMSVLAHPESM